MKRQVCVELELRRYLSVAGQLESLQCTACYVVAWFLSLFFIMDGNMVSTRVVVVRFVEVEASVPVILE